MKYLLILTLVSLGCLCYLAASIDISQLSVGKVDRAPDDVEELDVQPTSLESPVADTIEDRSNGLELPPQTTLVLMKFGASWCGPCRKIDKELRQVGRTGLPVEIRKIDIDDRPTLAERFGVQQIPHLVLIENGRRVAEHVGFMDAERISQWVLREAPDGVLEAKSQEVSLPTVHSNPFLQ